MANYGTTNYGTIGWTESCEIAMDGLSNPQTKSAHPCPRRRFLNCRGQGMAEYIIIVVVVAIVVLVSIRYFGGSVTQQFQNATDQIASVREDGESLSLESFRSGKDGSSANPAPVLSGGDAGGSGGDGTEATTSSERSSSGAGGNDKLSALKAGGVGSEEVKPIEEIKIDWKLLLIIAAIIIALGVALVLREAKKKGPKKDKKKAKKKFSLFKGSDKSESGQAMVEFVFSAITFLFVILGVIQLALVLNCYSLVRYAAYNAARAGIVNGADLTKMQEAARVSLLPVFPRHGRADQLRSITENYLAAKATDQALNMTYFNEPITKVRVMDNLGLATNQIVTFDDPKDADRSYITVEVKHLYELVIPLVNRILFYVYTKYRSGEGYQGQSLDNLSKVTDQRRRTGDFNDIEYRIPIVAYYTMRLQSDAQPF